jgi:hypothetical protein
MKNRYKSLMKPITKPLDKSDIERAIRHSKSNKSAARYLGVSLPTYKKYASMYTDEAGLNLYQKHCNPSGAGIPKMTLNKKNEPGLMDILEGRVNTIYFSIKKIKDRVIKEGYLKECCYRCGFTEKRVMDYKVPVILSFKDGNKRNWKLENLEFLCYNCYFLTIGDLFEKKQIEAMEEYTSLMGKKIDMDISKHQSELVKDVIDLNNRVINKREDAKEDFPDEDYGSELISFFKKPK